MNIKKIGAIALIASMTSLFGATGNSDSDGGKKYNTAYIDCEADGNKKYIMDYVSTSGGFDFTKHLNQLKRAKQFGSCTISGRLEIPYNIEQQMVDIQSNMNVLTGWNGKDQNPVIGGKKVGQNLTYGIGVLGNGKNKYVSFNLTFDSYLWDKNLEKISGLQFTLVVPPQKRGETTQYIPMKYFVIE